MSIDAGDYVRLRLEKLDPGDKLRACTGRYVVTKVDRSSDNEDDPNQFGHRPIAVDLGLPLGLVYFTEDQVEKVDRPSLSDP